MNETTDHVSGAGEEQFSRFERAQILLHEYDALRAEILSRYNSVFQVTAAAGAVFVWLMGRSWDGRTWVAATISTLVFGWLIALNFYDTELAGHRIRQLERDINSLAGTRLLEWERRWGWSRAGWRKRPLALAEADAEDRQERLSDARKSGIPVRPRSQ